MTARSALAHAKINLILETGARRADGYHDIDTVLQEIELADRVTISFGEFEGMRVGGPFASGTPAGQSNLAWRAAAELAQRCGRTLDGLGIALEKHIPAAGGLGGGASDAATVLRLLQQQWAASDSMLLDCANAIGSDEAFFLTGGTARARGRGELVEPLAPLHPHDVVLFIPVDTIEHKTARLFEAMDAVPGVPMTAGAAFARTMPRTLAATDVTNSFESVARDVFAGLGALWAELERRCGVPVHLAGAGPTLFWIGPPGAGAPVAKAAAGLQCTVVETRTLQAQSGC